MIKKSFARRDHFFLRKGCSFTEVIISSYTLRRIFFAKLGDGYFRFFGLQRRLVESDRSAKPDKKIPPSVTISYTDSLGINELSTCEQNKM
jgi:hypothetical protein